MKLITIIIISIFFIATINCIESQAYLSKKARPITKTKPPGNFLIYIDQKVDHFNPLDTRTFKQKVICNMDYFQPGGPVFLDLGGESQLEDFLQMYPFELELAEQFGALFIAFEHRYYGTSLPFGSNTTVESLKYLTTVQAIMDITTLYTRMMDLFNLPTNTTWISFGCSYAGMLSAFSRMKLPNLITAAVSGSSPIEAKIDYIEFDETVENAIPEDCKTILIEVNRRIENLLLTPEGKIALQGMFNTCQPFDTQYEALGLEYLITETLQLLVQYNNPPDYPLPAFCQAILQSQEPMQVLANYMIPVNSCINLDVNNFQQMNADRAWFWQKFTEFGYYKNTPQNSQLFFPNINMGFHYMYMNLLFGFMMDPAQDETNQYFGGYNFSDVTNIIFTNGRTDPWSKLSKLQNVSDSVTSYIYDSAAHCAPYHEFNSAMQPDLIFVRDQIVAFLSEILNQQKKKNK